MINIDLIERIQYPDQTDGIYFDTIDYEEAVRYLKYSIKISNGDEKKFHQDTLSELERRWEERQAKIPSALGGQAAKISVEIAAKKVHV